MPFFEDAVPQPVTDRATIEVLARLGNSPVVRNPVRHGARYIFENAKGQTFEAHADRVDAELAATKAGA